jgi:hypothetical protein
MSCPANAQQNRSLLGTSNPSPKAMSRVSPAGEPILSEEAKLVATSLGILPKLEQLQQARLAGGVSVDTVVTRQDCTEAILQSGLEVRTIAGRIDRELSNAGEVLAYLAERRDRAVRLNTYADLISGGITGVLSGGLKIADAAGVTPDIIDTAEGALQTGISTWALQQQAGEQRKQQGIPSILTHLFQERSSAQADYPASVWAYLSSPLPAAQSNASRLDILVDRWLKLGLCFTHRGHGPPRERALKVAGHLETHKVTIDVLEDRIAMLNDLRATIVQMDSDLLELMEVVRGGRKI